LKELVIRHDRDVRINRRSSRAFYQQLADLLRDGVKRGVYEPGAMLPSERSLMRQYGVSRPAIRHALAVLRHEGLITVEHGVGAKVREPVQRRAIVLHSGDELIGRMPTESERTTHLVDLGVPLLEIRRQTGAVELLVGDQVVIVATATA
jgi:DNA-binding transcriptional regulator YhcF (GntR family)